jgi:hypothetical protein
MRDNGDHVRAIVPLTLSYPGTLANNATLDGTYNLTEGGEKHILIYQGTIGVNNGTALDPVDAGIGIAAKTLTVTGGGCECYDHQAQGRLSQTVVTGGVAVNGINSLYTPTAGVSGTGSFKLYGGCGGATYSVFVLCGNVDGDSTTLTGGGLSISLGHDGSVRQNLVLGPCETANMFFVSNVAGPSDRGGYLDFCCTSCPRCDY